MAQEISWRPPTGDIPTNPGVYRFFDGNGRVLYVGKARNLRARLTNYFGPLHALHERTRKMVTTARNVRWVIVGSEMEALQLEYTWIKEFDPPFNVQFKDDKSYPYMALTMSEEYPRVMITRGRHRKGDVYLGPYTKVWAARETVDELLKVFPMRSCSPAIFKTARRTNKPCLLGDIGKCSAPCVGRVSADEHRRIADDFLNFMTGKDQSYLRQLRRDMEAASTALEFETAAQLRDKVAALEHVLQKSAVVLSSTTNADVVGLAMDSFTACIHVFIVRGGRIRGVRNWHVDLELDVAYDHLASSAIQSLYGETNEIPREILINTEPEEAETLARWLTDRTSHNVTIHVPQRGSKKAVTETADANAASALKLYERRRSSDYLVRSQAMSDIQTALQLDEAPLRIECFDISHLGGEDVVASMVVFEDGLAKKQDYRKYRIEHARDDTDAMNQVLTRRFQRLTRLQDAPPSDGDMPVTSQPPSGNITADADSDTDGVVSKRRESFRYRPNLLVVDGGLPQVHAAMAALKKVGINDLAVCGMAKRLEEVWIPNQEFPVILPRNSEALFLLQRVRDEAHRFAITFQRNTRTKRMQSDLIEVPGLGKKRALELLKAFGSLNAVLAATPEELTAVDGIGPALAQTVLQWGAHKKSVS